MAQLSTLNGEGSTGSPFQFTGVNLAGSNTFTLSGTKVYAGTYSYEALYSTGNAVANGYHEFSSVAVIYATGRIYFSTDYAHTGSWVSHCMARLMQGEWNPCLRLAIASGGTSAPYRWYISGNSITDAYSTVGVSIGEWHKVDIIWKAGAGSASYGVYIDDTLIASTSGSTFTYTYGTRAYLGGTNEFGAPAGGSEVYYDSWGVYDSTTISTGVAGLSLPLAMSDYRRWRV